MNSELIIHKNHPSPKFNPGPIQIDFLILHYTAGPLKESLELLTHPEQGGSSHLVVCEQGEVYELVNCLDGRPDRAWHAGKSRYEADGKLIEGLNDCSIGIELVNRNGNVFDFTDEQYQALALLLNDLKSLYPTLKDPKRVIGHEHCAGYRGKCDPGWCFDWSRFFSECYPGEVAPERLPTLTEAERDSLCEQAKSAPDDATAEYWFGLSSQLEGRNLDTNSHSTE